MIAARDQYGAVISEAFMVRYRGQRHKVFELIKGGAIGQVRSVDRIFTLENSRRYQQAIDAIFAVGEHGDWQPVAKEP